ncbi:MAG: DUF3307 domain-containing protein [Sphingobacteriales bacterium]|jgi:hypothetical protein|nr:DUF3307 domain-containing protein [Sphingobacteriales bacterium]MBP9141666.1 DUF3307 domain-containing protein [Chitinophagales bacterium]MDA0197481.1 DUF3307 domain-containing protein [Bacteroidota bacterium]MBK6890332.1 DUF3307 domain-containing protein [Sphingobacteriales bacterium]MBK7526615.1 DUF3307 domain-containing protein [Sphingobacteriales bacterium]
MLTAFIIILAHFVADFLLQTDKMALNKSKSNYWLTMHVLAYTAGMALFTVYMVVFEAQNWLLAAKWLGINACLHWLTDFNTSRLTSILWQRGQRHWFFVAIGFDQVVHYACLMGTYAWLTT